MSMRLFLFAALSFLPAPACALQEKAPATRADDEARIRETLNGMVAAMSRGDGRAFAEHFHLPRMLDEMRVLTGFKPAEGERQEAVFVAALRVGLAKMALQQKELGFGWDSARILRVRFHEKKPEADAYGTLVITGTKSKARFRLIKEGETWKIWDVAFPSEGIQITFLMGSVLAEMSRDGADRASMRAAFLCFQRAAVHLSKLEFDETLNELKKGRERAAPGAIGGFLDILECTALVGLGRVEESLKLADGAVVRNPDIPILHFLRATALFQLDRHEECIAAAGVFIKDVGEDADAFLLIGQAAEELEDPKRAIEAYRKGAACDEEEYENRHALALLLLKGDGRAEATKLLVEACRNAPKDEDLFGTVADELIEAEAHGVLLELAVAEARRTSPDARLMYYQGHAQVQLKGYEGAERALRACLEKNDEEWTEPAREDLAVALAHLGREDEALAEAGKLQEDAALAAYLQAYIRAVSKKEGEALKALGLALKRGAALYKRVEEEPVFAALREQEACRALLGRAKVKAAFDESASYLLDESGFEALAKLSEKHAQAMPEDPDGWYYLGRARSGTSNHAESEKAYRAGLEREEAAQHGRFWTELAKCLAHLGRVEEALSFARKLRETEAWEAGGYYVEAYVHAVAKAEEKALEALGKALQKESWRHLSVEEEPVFAELRTRPAWRELLKKAKGEPE
jgi:hypothetical protein